ncbi:molybdenum cofactor guanylyltransferase [Cohnella pontilimi]|nr:molybdenum cofactor guanylyltransferase [Cohnella pontilimi]
MDVSAVILAGGLGRRMGGRNKALLSLGEDRFIDRQIRVCKGWTSDVVIVTNDDGFAREVRQRYEVTVVADRYAGQGPLAGLQAGVAAVSGRCAWVLGCDQPLPNVDAAGLLYERMLQHGTMAALPVIEGLPQPLHALYRKEASVAAEEMLRQGERRLLSLLDRISWIGVGADDFEHNGIPILFAEDVDTPEDYERICRKPAPS